MWGDWKSLARVKRGVQAGTDTDLALHAVEAAVEAFASPSFDSLHARNATSLVLARLETT
jgi:hypothetical protein